jgi:hypothetical protein
MRLPSRSQQIGLMLLLGVLVVLAFVRALSLQ